MVARLHEELAPRCHGLDYVSLDELTEPVIDEGFNAGGTQHHSERAHACARRTHTAHAHDACVPCSFSICTNVPMRAWLAVVTFLSPACLQFVCWLSCWETPIHPPTRSLTRSLAALLCVCR
jgi:hypothetical protein